MKWLIILTATLLYTTSFKFVNGHKSKSEESSTGSPSSTTSPIIKPYPFMVYLNISNKGFPEFCGGSLIAPDLVLTGAHCVYNRETGNATEPGSVVVYTRNGTHQEAKEIIAHPDFKDKNASLVSLALIKLPIDFLVASGIVKPIALPQTNYSVEMSKSGMVLGWGGTPRTEPDRDLEIKTGFIVEDTLCSEKYSSVNYNETGNFCVEQKQEEDDDKISCPGAGPFVVFDTDGSFILYGVSYENGSCNDENNPGIYTLVPKHVAWIGQHITKHDHGKKGSAAGILAHPFLLLLTATALSLI